MIEAEILNGLRDELQTTLIVVAYRLSTITLADRVLVLDQGRIVATGQHAELLGREPRYAAIVQADRFGGLSLGDLFGLFAGNREKAAECIERLGTDHLATHPTIGGLASTINCGIEPPRINWRARVGSLSVFTTAKATWRIMPCCFACGITDCFIVWQAGHQSAPTSTTSG